jgi:hypothetical protein
MSDNNEKAPLVYKFVDVSGVETLNYHQHRNSSSLNKIKRLLLQMDSQDQTTKVSNFTSDHHEMALGSTN